MFLLIFFFFEQLLPISDEEAKFKLCRVVVSTSVLIKLGEDLLEFFFVF